MPTGSVTLVGAGPGDPGLLTVKGAQALATAQVVVFDRLVSPAILAQIPANAEKINVGKTSGSHPVPQKRIQEILLEKAQEGKRVVRLKGGDPFLFGRGSEELEDLAAHGIPFCSIPGISSAIAAPAYAGIPVTARGLSSSVHIISGHGKDNEAIDLPFAALANTGGTLVFLMGVAALEQICTGLLAAGLPSDTPAAVVENGTLPTQRRFCAPLERIVSTARQQGVHSPAVLVVGAVCKEADRLDWFTRLPLFGCRVAVTMPEDTAEPLVSRLRALGAEPLLYPCMRTEEPVDNAPLRESIRRLKDYRFLVFTSRRGVESFFHGLHHLGLDTRALAGHTVAAIAAQTAASLKAYGICPDLVPAVTGSTHLAQTILFKASAGDRALLCRSDKASPVLPAMLRAGGLEVDDIPAYQTVIPPPSGIDTRMAENPPDYVVFTSGSAVDGFLHRSGMQPAQIRGVCIGNITAKIAQQHDIRCITAGHSDIQSVVEKLIEVKQHGTF